LKEAMALLYEGDACSINKRYAVGYKGSGPHRKAFLRSTKEYKAFCDDLIFTFTHQAKGNSFGSEPVHVGIVLKRRKKRGRYVDIDAYVKPIIDALEHAGIIENDRQVVSLTVDATTEPVDKEYEEIVVFVDDGKFA
jgi:Holliday junction resolvase RusA-like endonuclease